MKMVSIPKKCLALGLSTTISQKKLTNLAKCDCLSSKEVFEFEILNALNSDAIVDRAMENITHGDYDSGLRVSSIS